VSDERRLVVALRSDGVHRSSVAAAEAEVEVEGSPALKRRPELRPSAPNATSEVAERELPIGGGDARASG
jgi:hypothetical protein